LAFVIHLKKRKKKKEIIIIIKQKLRVHSSNKHLLAKRNTIKESERGKRGQIIFMASQNLNPLP